MGFTGSEFIRVQRIIAPLTPNPYPKFLTLKSFRVRVWGFGFYG